MRGNPGPELVAEYDLARENSKGKTFVMLMLEGETDSAFWTDYTAQECYLVYADGKDDIVCALNAGKLCVAPNVAGIVDSDYWLITQSKKLDTPNMLYDDCCPDIEVFLLNSPVLNKVLRNTFTKYGRERVDSFVEKLRNESLRLAMEIGYFRLLNYCENYHIPFKRFWRENRRIKYIDEKTLKFSREQFSKELKGFYQRISSVDLLTKVDQLEAKYPQPNIQLCQGKDVLNVLGEILPILFHADFGKTLSRRIQRSFDYMELSTRLRESYDSRYFKDTSLYASIRKWETANCRYKILYEDI